MAPSFLPDLAPPFPEPPSIATRSFALLALLTLLLLLHRAAPPPLASSAATLLAAHPASTAATAAAPAAPRRRSAALLYFGNVGAASIDEKESARGAFSLEAAAGCAPSVAQHVLRPAQAAGWAVDAFAHSWSAEHGAALTELLAPVNASFGRTRGGAEGGMAASIEAALDLMEAHVAGPRRGAPYDAVLALRYDTLWFAPFSFAAVLREPGAVYVAHWCKAGGAGRLPPGPPPAGLHGCFALAPFWADEEGVPDFWFGGTPGALSSLFRGLQGDLARGAVAPGRTCKGKCGHAQVWGGLVARRVPLRRYLLHQVDFDLFRHRVCGMKWGGLEGVPWRGGGGADESGGSGGNASQCGGGQFVCAWHEAEIQRCGVFGLEPRQFPARGG